MKKDDKEKAGTANEDVKDDDIHNEDFQFALKELLNGYRPILEEELRRSGEPEQLDKEAQQPVNCEDEIKLANRIFEKFFSEEVAVRLLPAQARELLGPIERWRWCWLHIRCCIIFGWLVCRGPRTFRAFAYYLYRYWLCVREVIGRPVSSPPTAEERQDFQTLIQAVADAYKPYLTDQLASVEFPLGLPDEVLSGKIDCFEGEDETAAIFERLLTINTAQALLGKEAFEAHSRESFFWFCRCWCLCAIRFGCCLARARGLIGVVRCLIAYWRCLRRCFRPLTCEVTGPDGCFEEAPIATIGGLGVPITGTASGAGFSHYTLEWRRVGITPFSTSGITLTSGGTVPIVGGLLGYLNTTFLDAGLYEIRLTVFSALGGGTLPCTHQFTLFKTLVVIERVADLPGAPVQAPPGPFDGAAPIVDHNPPPAPPGIIVPVGGCISVKGGAWVGECEDRRVKCIDLRYAIDWQPGPNDVGFAASLPLYANSMLLAPICYDDPDPVVESKKRAWYNQLRTLGSVLTSRWVEHTIDLGGGMTDTIYKLERFCFNSGGLLPTGISVAGCPDVHHRCRSGKYTLLLRVEDTLGNVYYETQRVWFDNKPITVEFTGLEGLPACSDLSLKQFVPAGGPCDQPWPINLRGIAFDEFIDETDPSYPSNNFDAYTLYITRQGGPVYSVPITMVLPPLGGTAPLQGTQAVGDPGTRCEPTLAVGGCPPPTAIPPHMEGILTKLDLRVFDADCAPSLALPPFTPPFVFAPPADFALKRGECCGYTFQLHARDKTWSDGYAGGLHNASSLPWAVCICNDLPTGKP